MLVHVQELGLANEWVSELIFTSLFVAFVLWSFSPFVFPKKRFYTAVLYARFLTALVGAPLSLSPALPACLLYGTVFPPCAVVRI